MIDLDSPAGSPPARPRKRIYLLAATAVLVAAGAAATYVATTNPDPAGPTRAAGSDSAAAAGAAADPAAADSAADPAAADSAADPAAADPAAADPDAGPAADAGPDGRLELTPGAAPSLGPGPHRLRLEVESRSGTVRQIAWDADLTAAKPIGGKPADDPIPAPWSTSMTLEKIEYGVTLKAISSDTDEVTCRIVAGDQVIAESSRPRAAICSYNPRFEQMMREQLEQMPQTEG
ncbi:hypothetical protein [Actinoplanes sp. DH11]|uniref:hypothetical protein n=1 Tax=Actinoplanes sp. DH11 TaxID=2857011 RepID=UPI001E61E863|nr:hypothetical protein [Actinoplanes sp. DH11]